jgi:putative ABC transport system permease protein
VRSAVGERIATALTHALISRRMNLFRHRALAALAIGAVATSAAVAVVVEVASRSVRGELLRTTAAVMGAADLEIVSAPRGVPEGLLERVRVVPGVREASALIAETIRIVTSDPAGVSLHVLGVDLLADRKSFDFEVEHAKVVVRDPLSLLAKPNSILITATLAERLGFGLGARLPVRVMGARHDLTVEGLITDGDFGRAYGGQIAVMDVYALQSLVSAVGFVDRIDLITEAIDRDATAERVRSVVGSSARVRRPTPTEGVLQAMLASLDAMLWAIPALGVMLGAVLAHAAISQLVRARTRALALMQCVGLTRGGVVAIVVSDSLVLSAIGVAVGLAVGIESAPLLVRGFSVLSEHIGDVEIEALSLAPSTLRVALGVWIGVALLAAVQPIRYVTQNSPLAILTDSHKPEGAPPVRRGALVHALVTTLAVLALAFAPTGGEALERVLAGTALALLALIVSGADCLRWVVQRARPLLVRIPRIGRLLGFSILGRPLGASTSMAAIAILVGLLVALLSVVQSTVISMHEWTARRFDGSAAIFAGAPNAGLGGESVAHTVVEAIREIPGVDDLAVTFTTTVPLGGMEVPIQAASIDVLLRRGAIYPEDAPPASLAAALKQGGAAVSYAFANHFGVAIGDWIDLPTRDGERSFRVGGIIRNFTGPTGTVLFDVATFDRHYARDGATSVRIWSNRPYEEVEKAILERVAGAQPLFFSYGEDDRNAASRTLQRFRGLLYLVVAVASLFTVAALLNLLASNVTSRRRDLALMQTVGARTLEVVAAIVVDTAIVAATGITCGVLLGLFGGKLVCEVLFQKLGWIIDYQIDASVLLVPATILVGACAVIGVAIAVRLSRDEPLRAIATGG